MADNSSLAAIRPLTSEAYDLARETAIERVNKRIGDKPVRRDFEREMGALATPLDWIALIVFVAALLISSLHIIAFMTEQSVASYATIAAGDDSAGITISPDVWAVVHQLGAILLAEAAALLFMTMHNMSSMKRAHLASWRRWVSIPLLLAMIAAAFVLMANLHSGVNVLVSLMPPLFTLGIAVRLEALIATYLRRRDDVGGRYIEALTIWERASKDVTDHPDFKPILAQELWASLLKGRGNAVYADAPLEVRRAAVRRELQRETWAADIENAAGETVEITAPLAAPPTPAKKTKAAA